VYYNFYLEVSLFYFTGRQLLTLQLSGKLYDKWLLCTYFDSSTLNSVSMKQRAGNSKHAASAL